MPKKNAPRNLRDFCFQTIIDNLATVKIQVKNLPYSLINQLFDQENSLKYKCTTLSSKIYLNSCTTKLDFYELVLGLNASLNAGKCIKRIFEVCEVNNLTYIDLSYCSSIKTPLQVKLIERFHQIQFLNISNLGSDSVLSVIATHCAKLRHLDTSCSRKVTDKGIKFLCVNKNLKIGYLHIGETKVTANGCLHALKNLKFLKTFMHSCWVQLFKMLKLEMYSTPPYLLKSLKYLYACVLTEERLNVASVVFPNLREIALTETNFDYSFARNMSKFDNITKLTVWQNRVDINLVGIYCPMIQKLHLFFSTFTNLHSNLIATDFIPFRHLRNLDLHCYNNRISEKDLNSLLANCQNLKKLRFSNCQTLTDDLFINILRVNPLHHLTDLILHSSNFISIKSLMAIFDMDNLLNCVQISDCALLNQLEISKLQNYIEKNNLDVSLCSNDFIII